MRKCLFISDPSLIIDLLKKFQCYGAFLQFYKERYLPEQAKDLLNRQGFDFDEEQIEKIDLTFSNFDLDRKELIPDILLFLKIFETAYSTAKILRLPEYGIRQLNFIKELKTLDLLLNQKLDDKYTQIEKIQLKFRRRSKIPMINIDSRRSIKYLMDKLKEFLKDDLNYREIQAREENLKKFYLQYGQKSDKKDNLRSSIRNKTCLLFREYLIYKSLLGMTKHIRLITDKGALFVGKILDLINLMDHSESDFENDNLSRLTYKTYDRYLIRKVRGYISDGRKFIN